MTDTVNVPRELFSTLIWAAEKSGLCSSRELASGQALLAADQPAVEEVEVVGTRYTTTSGTGRKISLVRLSRKPRDGWQSEDLMTVRQHESILAAALAAK
ncbi:hypothetical protein [Pseudomonas sp. Marseille-QA0892]